MKSFATIIFTFSFIFLFLFTGVYSDGAKTYKVKGGKIKIKKITFHVYKGVKKVEESFGGISYTITKKSNSAAMKEAKKITKYYTGKKVGKFKIGKFKPSAKPETTAWVATTCKKGKGVEAIVKVEGEFIYVYIVPGCNDVEGMVL
jgi:hypothetical protein